MGKKLVALQAMVEPETADLVRLAADRLGVSISSLIRSMVEEFVSAMNDDSALLHRPLKDVRVGELLGFMERMVKRDEELERR